MEFWSADRRFGLSISPHEFSKILADCRASRGCETGGIVIGHYTESRDCARITVVTAAPKDSGKSHMTFFRGFQGLTAILGELWEKKKQYYLGEWHFHPYASPTPSSRDIAQMHTFAKDPAYNCPEPLMLLIGGDPDKEWNVRAFVFPQGKVIEMEQ